MTLGRTARYGWVFALVAAIGCTSHSRQTGVASSPTGVTRTIAEHPVGSSAPQLVPTTAQGGDTLPSSTTAVSDPGAGQLPPLSASRIAQEVTRSANSLTLGLAAVLRCGSNVDTCLLANERAVQANLQAVKVLADNVKIFQASNRVPDVVTVLLDQTGKEADAIVALGSPGADGFACGPDSSTWPQSQDKCAKRYQELGQAELALVDTLQQWDDKLG